MIEVDGYDVSKQLSGSDESEVYAAREPCGRMVAIKLYRRAETSIELSRANREFRILRELAGSRGVVEVVETMLVGGTPAIVTALAPGVPLSRYLRDRDLRDDIRTFLSLATQLAHTLTSVHDAHIVHKDLKPQNIIVDPSGPTTCIIDFGISSKVGRAQSPHDAPTRGQGTWIYAAPEQSGLIDRGIDYRTDLYALGGVFFEMLAGRPPFCESSQRELVHAHLAARAPSLLEVGRDVPPVLARIVDRLLTKEPDSRYQTALGLYHDLGELHTQVEATGRITERFELGRRDGPLRVRFSRELRGREEERAVLGAALRRAIDGRASLVLVGGPAGIGKSSLVRSLSSDLLASDGRLIQAKFDLSERKAPYAGIASALQDWASQVLIQDDDEVAAWGERIRTALGNIAGVVVGLAPEFALILGDVPDVPRLGAAQTRARLELAVERLFQCLAPPGAPLVLVLDDLQWADSPSLALLCAACRNRRSSLLVLATHRGGDPPELVASTVRAIRESGIRVDHVELESLSLSEVGSMLSCALERDEATGLRLAGLLERKTQNNPWLVQRLVESLQEAEVLRYRPGVGWVWDDSEVISADLPAEIAEILAGKVAALDASAIGVLELASCAGDTFDLDVLARSSRAPRAEIESALYCLQDAALISTCRSGYRFAHDRIREATLARLSPGERRALHYATACALLDRELPQERAALLEVASHLQEALDEITEDRRTAAIDVLTRAAESLLGDLAVEAARAAFAAARSLFDTGEDGDHGDWERIPSTSLSLFVGSAETALLLRRFEEAEENLEQVRHRSWAPVERLAVSRVAMLLRTSESGPAASIQTVIEEAAHFGLEWSRVPSDFSLAIRRRWYLARWRRRRIPDQMPSVELPEDVDARAQFLVHAGVPISASGSRLAQLCSEGASDVYFRYGYYKSPCLNLVGWSITFCRSRDYVGAIDLVERGLAWERKHPQTFVGARARWVGHRFLAGCKESRRSVLSRSPRVIQELLELGDTEYARYHEIFALIWSAELGATPTQLRTQIASDEVSRLMWNAPLFKPLPMALEVLESHDPDAIRRIVGAVLDPNESGGQSPVTDLRLWGILALALCARGHYTAARAASELARRNQNTDLPVAEVLVAHAVSVCGQASEQGRRLAPHERRLLAAMERTLDAKTRLGNDASYLTAFVRAERLCARGRCERGVELLEDVRKAADEHGTPNFSGLAAHRRGIHLLALRRETEAHRAFARAVRYYDDWGAEGVARELEARMAREA